MKNIAIAIIIAIVVSFSSAIAAEKRLDVSEEAVKTTIILKSANAYGSKWDISVKKMRNAKIVAHTHKNTKLGVVNYYAVTAEVKFEGQKDFFKGVFFVYTVHNNNAEMYSATPAILGVEYMEEYNQNLAEFTKKVKSLDKHQVILAKFAVGGRHL